MTSPHGTFWLSSVDLLDVEKQKKKTVEYHFQRQEREILWHSFKDIYFSLLLTVLSTCNVSAPSFGIVLLWLMLACASI